MDEKFRQEVKEMLNNKVQEGIYNFTLEFTDSLKCLLDKQKSNCESEDGKLDPYSIGLYNGIELARSSLLNEQPNFYEVKEDN